MVHKYFYGHPKVKLFLNPYSAESGFSFFENFVDPAQMASVEAIWSGSTLSSTQVEMHSYNWAADWQDKN